MDGLRIQVTSMEELSVLATMKWIAQVVFQSIEWLELVQTLTDFSVHLVDNCWHHHILPFSQPHNFLNKE